MAIFGQILWFVLSNRFILQQLTILFIFSRSLCIWSRFFHLFRLLLSLEYPNLCSVLLSFGMKKQGLLTGSLGICCMESFIPRPEGPRPSGSDKSSSRKFVLSVAWSPDGRRLACGSMDGTISIFDVARAKFLHHLDGHYMPVKFLVFSPEPDSRKLYSASDDGHVHIYDVEGKPIIGAMSGHSSWVLSVDVSPDGEAIATGSSDKTVRLWDFKMRAAIQVMRNHTDQGWAVAFRPGGGGRLASVSDDEHITV